MIEAVSGMFGRIGERGYFVRDIARGVKDPATYARETVRQMKNIGVDSLPLAAIVAAFIGAVTAFDAVPRVFGEAMTPMNANWWLSETLCYLRHLQVTGRAEGDGASPERWRPAA